MIDILRSKYGNFVVFVGGVLLSATIVFFAIWLHQNERNGWAHELKDGVQDQIYLARRRRSRSRVHLLFGISGILIMVATLAGPGIVFVAAWTCVAFALMTIVGLALLDAIRTQKYHSDKLSQIRHQLPDADDS